MEGLAKNLSLSWTGDLDSLNIFVKEILKLDGEWTQPGGDKKHFEYGNSSISWRKNKRLLSIDGEKSSEIKMEICKIMLKDNYNLETPLLQSQACLSDDKYSNEIEHLKENQRINNEAIQSLADSIVHISSTISQMQVTNIHYHESVRETPKSSAPNPNKHRNISNSDSIIVQNQLPLSTANTYVFDNHDHVVDLMALASNDDENQVNDHSITTGMSLQPDPIQKPSYADIVQGNPQSQSSISNSPDHFIKPVEKAKTKEIAQMNPPVSVTNTSDGFIGVARKRRRKYKQFFLSGIAKNVNEDQIVSYLVERNVTPHNITIFQSKRVETISAKIRIPSACSAVVLQEDFWPKFILCKPWLQKPKENERRRIISNNNNTLMGNYATYV